MGTRGRVFIRYKGRYYVYYSNMDSYPDGLGASLVNEIPKDRADYQAWLERLRHKYARLNDQVENKILCVNPRFSNPETLSLDERCAGSYIDLDQGICGAPTQALLLSGDGDIFIEWTYTIDLDRELFAVDNALFFDLAKMSHHPNWWKFLTEDRYQRRALKVNAPSDLIHHVVHKVEVDDGLRSRYNSFSVESQTPGVLESFEPRNASRTALLARTISAVCHRYRSLIDGFYMDWELTSFPFREIAYAILSIAAGEVAFKSPQDLNACYKWEGFFYNPKSDGRQTLLPKFLEERHNPGVAPGSAPQSNPFWLGEVLVYLTTRMDLLEVEEAAIAVVVDNGLNQGLSTFHAIVFSVLDFILLHVGKDDNGGVQVERSPLTNLIYFDDATSRYPHGPRSRGTQGSENDSEQMSENLDAETGNRGGDYGSIDTPDGNDAEDDDEDSSDGYDGNNSENAEGEDGSDESDEDDQDDDDDDDAVSSSAGSTLITLPASIVLVNFFDATIDQSLARTKSDVFPNEILTTIMELSDYQTYLALSRASACCRENYYREFRLNDDYAIVKESCDLTSRSFTLRDLESEDKMETSFDLEDSWFKPKKYKICPIIGVGDSTRASILSSVDSSLDITPKRPPFRGPKDKPICLSDYTKYMYGCGRELLFQLPERLSLDIFEDAFGSYLRAILESLEHQPIHGISIRSRTGPFSLFPPSCKELYLPQIDCSGLRAFIRHGRDENPEEWARTTEYAAQKLHDKEKHPEYCWDKVSMGSPVVVAFGTKLKLLYYINKQEKPPSSVASFPFCKEIAARCTEEDPRSRLVHLVSGDEPVDLRDTECRKKFDAWITSFCSPQGGLEFEEWDPFTGSMRRPELKFPGED